MVDYKSGQALSLVNETYAERNAGQAVDAGTKVSTDEVVAELTRRVEAGRSGSLTETTGQLGT